MLISAADISFNTQLAFDRTSLNCETSCVYPSISRQNQRILSVTTDVTKFMDFDHGGRFEAHRFNCEEDKRLEEMR